MMTLKDYIRQHYSEKSVPRYIQQINQFISYQGGEINKTNYSEVVEYIGILRERNLHPKSLKNHLFSLKIYFRYLVAVGKRQDHPCESLYLKDQIQRSIIVESLYSKEQLEELYNTFESPVDQRKWATKSESIKKRDKVILSLLIFQALTTTEIIELEVKDIDLEECAIEIKANESKGRRGNKARILALQSKQILLINDYLKVYRNDLWKKQKPSKRQDYFILNEEGLQLWGSYLNRMLSKGREPHEIFTPLKIRQSVIANLLKEKNDTRVVQEFAGHRRTGSTEAYKRTGLEELKANIEKLHPRQ
jgi:site-specific recombinase XerD